MTAIKKMFLFFCWVELTFGGEGTNILWGGKNFANRFLFTMKKLHVHQMHVPKWPSYFCKI